jgi:hypothetical protein
MTIEKQTAQAFLEHLGEALETGRLERVVSSWDIPALVVAKEGTRDITSSEQVREFYGSATRWYHFHGLHLGKPAIERFETLGSGLASVDVEWRTRKNDGTAACPERSRYILRLDAAGSPKICVALSLDPFAPGCVAPGGGAS